ncbi:hypothetical protein Tco_0535516 [Tanacetum coccineum]
MGYGPRRRSGVSFPIISEALSISQHVTASKVPSRLASSTIGSALLFFDWIHVECCSGMHLSSKVVISSGWISPMAKQCLVALLHHSPPPSS